VTSPVRLVAGREIRQRIRSRAFIISTVFIAVLILGIGVLTRVLSGGGPASADVAVVGTLAPEFSEVLDAAGQANDVRITIVTEPDRAAAEAALRRGAVDAVVVPADRALLFHQHVDDAVERSVGAAWQVAAGATAAEQLGLTPAETNQVLAPPPLQTTTVGPASDDGAGIVVGIVAAILLFAAVSTFGGYVLVGVVEEKTSAIVELLLARVRAQQLLAGKVLGIGTVALVQFAVAVVAGIAALLVSGASIPVEIWVAVPTTLLWFLGGFALFSTLFALAGSFVSRQEDAQAAAAPVTLAVLAAYLTVYPLSAAPDSIVATGLALVPPFSPLLMPLRIATGNAAVWQIVIAAVILVGATYVVLRTAAAIYARTLLQRGRRISWRQALHLRAS
jgi:ABC-2 type transport system permease protein